MIKDEDRIRWKYGWFHAQQDTAIFHAYVRGEITEDEAIRRIEQNNDITITKRQFRENLKWLGWTL